MRRKLVGWAACGLLAAGATSIGFVEGSATAAPKPNRVTMPGAVHPYDAGGSSLDPATAATGATPPSPVPTTVTPSTGAPAPTPTTSASDAPLRVPTVTTTTTPPATTPTSVRPSPPPIVGVPAAFWGQQGVSYLDDGQSDVNGPTSSAYTRFTVPNGQYASLPYFGPTGDMYMIQGPQSISVEHQVLVAYGPGGQQLWTWDPVPGDPLNQPVFVNYLGVGPDGTIYAPAVPQADFVVNGVSALDPLTGKVRWATVDELDQRGPVGSPTVGPDGTIYLQGMTHVIAISPAGGAVAWSWPVPAGSCQPAAPVTSPDGSTIYVGGNDGSVTAVRAGKTIWTRAPAFPGDCPGRPAVAATGQLFLTDNGPDYKTSQVVALGPDGHQLWTAMGSFFNFQGGPALTSTGLVIAQSQGGMVSAWDTATGQLDWTVGSWYPQNQSPNGGSVCPIIVGADGTVYTSDGYKVQAIGPAGKVDWTLALPSANVAYPVLDPNGRLYMDVIPGNLQNNLEVFG